MISGETPKEPVISAKTGRIYEKRLLQKYLDESGTEPHTDYKLSEEEIIAVFANPPAVKPRPPTLTSIPALLSTFQNEWDALVLETFTLKQQYQQVRQELSQALYQNDAASRVIARLMKERDEARQALTALQAKTVVASTAAGSSSASRAMDVDSIEQKQEQEQESNKSDAAEKSPEDIYFEKASEASKVLSKARLKRETPAGLATVDDWKSAVQRSLVESLHTSTKPGIVSICLDKTGTLALTGGMDNHAEVYSRDSDRTLATLKGHTKKITAALWINGGGLDKPIITASADKSIRIWSPKPTNSEQDVDLRSIGWTKTHIIKAHSSDIVGLSLHPCGDYFVSAASEGTWAIHTLDGKTIIEGSIDSPISQIAFHPDGMFLGIATSDGFAKIVDVKQKQVLATLDVASALESKAVTGLDFSENGYYFASASAQEVAVWDLRKQKKAQSWALSDIIQDDNKLTPDKDAEFIDARFDFSGKYFAIAAENIHVFRVKGWSQLTTLTASDCIKSISWVGSEAKEIVAVSMDNTLRSYGPFQE
ncbi:hypothetical protein LPJ64_005483 [Coemansia asiatica]|uniref:Pre-mRNA-processing factor 19 n=1 Tax=Coemansia asiatica TaxID=1052880 RepID=A0A9W7XGE2_9FUNG|nr:hypothetical protein LPJ64_005483 [Coemansia asiatica]